VLALLMVSACSDELVTNNGYGEVGDDVTIDFGLDIPQRGDAKTRTFTETTDAEFKASDAKIVILAFDENHYLTNVYEGEYLSDNNDGVVKYRVTLKSTDQKRIFHVIVNHNELDISKISYGMESEVLTSDQMIVDQGTDVYWGRATMDAASTTDGFAENAKKALDGIKLVRNYAKLELKYAAGSDASDKLKDVEWAMMSIPTKGSVAPYISDQNFANYVDETTSGGMADYNNLYKQGYRGYVPRNASNGDSFYKLPSADYATDEYLKWVDMDTPIYTFENEGSSESQWWTKPVLLMRGHYLQDDGKYSEDWSYYRISLVDADRNYEVLNILRNIVYTIKLNSILDKGAATAVEAYTSPSSSNSSGATETSAYQSVNIGDAVLRVEYMRKYILYQQKFTMMARYVENVISDTVNGYYKAQNDSLKLTSATAYNTSKESEPAIVGSLEDGYAIASWEKDEKDTLTNYRNFRFTSNTPLKGEMAVSSKVRVTVKNKPSLYRDVEFILRERFKMKEIELKSDGDNTYTLTVEVPYGLPKEIFPLDFTFESSPACLYPDASRSIMAVSGIHPSIFDSSSTSSFHFHRTVAYSKYSVDIDDDGPSGFVKTTDGYKRISFFFKVNTASISNNQEIKIGVWSNDFSPNPDADVDASTAQYIYLKCKYTTSGGLTVVQE
jgi:hypothetical protein